MKYLLVVTVLLLCGCNQSSWARRIDNKSMIVAQYKDRDAFVAELLRNQNPKDYVAVLHMELTGPGVEYIVRYKTITSIPEKSVPCPQNHGYKECWLLKYEN